MQRTLMALGSLAVTKNDGHYRGDPNWFMKYVATGSLWGSGGLGWSAVVKIKYSRGRNIPGEGVRLGEMRSYFCTPTFNQCVLHQAP